MEKIRKLYKTETNSEPTHRVPRFAGDQFGPEEFTEEYVGWLEKKAAGCISLPTKVAKREGIDG